ncbi:Rid family hydrolase, partial [Turicimonas muris]
MSEIKRIRVNNRFSEAVVHGGIVYISGQVDLSAARTARQQTKNVLAIIDELLAEAGTDKSRLLRAFVYLANIGDLQDMNKE